MIYLAPKIKGAKVWVIPGYLAPLILGAKVAANPIRCFSGAFPGSDSRIIRLQLSRVLNTATDKCWWQAVLAPLVGEARGVDQIRHQLS